MADIPQSVALTIIIILCVIAYLIDAINMRCRRSDMKRDDNIGLVALFSFLVGGLVGAGLALVLAPQSGKKTRRQIMEFAGDVKEQAAGYAERLKEKVF